MSWLAIMRRWLEGRPPPPPETKPETSVLFCLQTSSPMTFEQIYLATRIEAGTLRNTLEELLAAERITESIDHSSDSLRRLYHIRYPGKY